MYRVLKPGGHVMILEFSTPEHFPMKQLYSIYQRQLFHLSAGCYRKKKQLQLPAGFYQGGSARKGYDRTTHRLGFSEARVRTFTFGICSLYTGTKE